MKQTLTGERVLITGASGGIGREMAISIAAKGGIPVLTARSEDKLRDLADVIYEQFGIRAPVYRLDVADQDEVDRVIAAIYQNEGAITTLINNAGYAIFDYIEEMRMEDARGMFDTNVLGTIACTKAVLPRMRKQRYGSIIFVASLAGKIATPKASAYSASKHAVIGFANAIRMETMGEPISVSTVNPGPIETDFFVRADKTGTYKENVRSFMLDAGYVAERTVRLILKPKREIEMPFLLSKAAKLYQLFPRLAERIAGKQMSRK
ncbi:SDR family NAD(P)-dependent oxidoreductase [Salisediminibacterium selenitireducens]|uniref:Short-chain dehydrogenase/reductase SDR n=1 Tax=Bacillus selenitireducens (strain ATCC 700615 / DSM 15326 / MLS10) TaxID=439292 RepID=D6XVI8_BACIE|nr:SDR family oxidoreductase [Salisediminibacterium selenitireducens]ADH99726.1 short-chain dehydrogenase/reductase SDR [[Bacillus] selenitireducens MLS10]